MPYSIKLLIPKQLEQMASNITNLESFYNIFVFQSILQMISFPLKKFYIHSHIQHACTKCEFQLLIKSCKKL